MHSFLHHCLRHRLGSFIRFPGMISGLGFNSVPYPFARREPYREQVGTSSRESSAMRLYSTHKALPDWRSLILRSGP